MKFSFFISLLFSIYLYSLRAAHAATELPLGFSDSFDGNAHKEAFVPKTTTGGATYTLTGNVEFFNLGQSTSLSSSCFSDSTGDLTFIGRGYDLSFRSIDAGANVTAVSVSGATQTLQFSGFSLLSFILSPSVRVTTARGAVKSTHALVFQDNKDLVFVQNFSIEDGGAVNTKTLTLTGTQGQVLFLQNQATTGKKGGALYTSDAATLTGNTGTLTFTANTAGSDGGALSVAKNCTITNNTSVVFSANSVASGHGGALCCDTEPLMLSGNGTVKFEENVATEKGGAIYAKQLTLSSGGPGGIFFVNNKVVGTTPLGGGIAIAPQGTVSLSADAGDITFVGNTTATTGSSAITKRSALDLGSTAKFTALRAALKANRFSFTIPL
ncbi:Pmp family polymorphic membrane protein autotransporter adhesin [Candidatus Chlamydia sanziniae]|uniref:Pmp family polymorphic membrane protein autotransporter adhesin n=1 Tax=Candidatus Chlamydia sanziniae TaxID=1806891 RepID=UPI0012E8BD10|nr:Pmp family polymorphic membrane protein autotransporter adhesin [Candidatus Chlamydia sanziniae]